MFKYKSKIKIKPKFAKEYITLQLIFLKVTSKKFKKFFNFEIKFNNKIYITDKYKYDILLYKALQYVK